MAKSSGPRAQPSPTAPPSGQTTAPPTRQATAPPPAPERQDRAEQIRQQVRKDFFYQSQEIQKIIEEDLNLSDIRQKLLDEFEKREGSVGFPPPVGFPPLSDGLLDLVAEYDFLAFPNYPGAMVNTEFWFFVARSYETVKDNDHTHNKPPPPRGLVLP
jgi:hypothetical protein